MNHNGTIGSFKSNLFRVKIMETLKTQEQKEIIKASLIELMNEDRQFFKDILSEIIEDAGMINAIHEGRKNQFVDEKKIMDILDSGS